jgi:hypothetical protein
MNEDFSPVLQYFHERRSQAVVDFVDSRRAANGDEDAMRRLLLSLNVDVTDEQAAVATIVSEALEA